MCNRCIPRSLRANFIQQPFQTPTLCLLCTSTVFKSSVLSPSRHLACRQVILSIAVLVEDAEGRVGGVVLVGVPESVGHLEEFAGNRAPVLASIFDAGNSCTLGGTGNRPRGLSDPAIQSAVTRC